jgi:hypothetical protein
MKKLDEQFQRMQKLAGIITEEDKSGITKEFKFGSESGNQFKLELFSNGDMGISDASNYLGLTNKDAKELSEILKQVMGLATEGQLFKENEEDMGDMVPAEKLAKFLFNLDFDPNDEVLKVAISFNDIEELLPVMADMSGVGDEDERVAFDGLFTKFDFYDAAKNAGFEKHQIEYLLDHDYVRSLERG